MAHKKAILNKFISDPEPSEDSDNRSAIFDGRGWTIPETSISDIQSHLQTEIQPGPSTGNQDEQLNPSSSSSKSAIFKTDNSPISTDETPQPLVRPRTIFIETSSNNDIQLTSSNEGTIPILGTSLHPIQPTSDSSIALGTTASDKTTEIVITSGSEPGPNPQQLEDTIVVTSIPVKSDPPPLRASTIETSCGDEINLPSEIFGSTDSSDEVKKLDREMEENLKKIALCGLRWFKLNVSKYQKDVKLSKRCQFAKRCQMSKNETPRLWRRFTKKLNRHNEVHRY